MLKKAPVYKTQTLIELIIKKKRGYLINQHIVNMCFYLIP